MHFSLVRISTPKMPNTRCFDDVMLAMSFAFLRLGYEAEIRVNSFNPSARNICFGANCDPGQRWTKYPSGVIIMNLEQLEAAGYPWLTDEHYLNLLNTSETWDFSRRNVDYLAGRDIEAAFLPLGYVPEMTRLAPCSDPASDVLFYGAMTPRRRLILDELRSLGVKVNCLLSAYGQRRDQAIYNSRIVLNIHHSLPASLEVVRLGYVLANSRAVVSELAPDTYYYPELAGACVFSPYDQLVPTITGLLKDENAIKDQGARGFEIFSALKLETALEELAGRRAVYGVGADFSLLPRPDHLRIGSGCNFLNSALNVDEDERMKPDLVLSLAAPEAPLTRHMTSRFGEIALEPGSFKLISLPGLLSRAANPDLLMTRCLELLADDGQMLITVPYDLSEEAANCLRAFNETGFRRYTDQATLIGWAGAGFELVKVDYILSDYGRTLAARGRKEEALKLMPRAVSAIRVSLRKRILSPEEQNEAEIVTRSFYAGSAIIWEVDEPETRMLDLPAAENLPGLCSMHLRLWWLLLRRQRYLFNIKCNTGKKHDRYKDKLVELNEEIAKTKRLLSLFSL